MLVTALTTVEIKIPSVSNHVKETELQKLKVNLIIIIMINILQL